MNFDQTHFISATRLIFNLVNKNVSTFVIDFRDDYLRHIQENIQVKGMCEENKLK